MPRRVDLRMNKAAFVLMLILSGCSATNPGIRPLRPLELATAPYRSSVAATLTGSLSYDNGCLLFIEDQTKQSFLPVWPTGSVFNGTSVIFRRPGKADQPVVMAQEFVLGGTPLEWSQMPSPYYAPFEAQCRAAPLFVSEVRPAD
jgi:hypothetical protein